MRATSITIAALLAFIAFPAAAAEPSSNAPEKVLALGAGFGMAAGDFGYLVVDTANGSEVAEFNADQPFIPASVVKIPTTAAAIEILGGQHRFETTVSIEGNIAGGVLDGVLTLRGGGDPSLTGDDLKALARDIAKLGIKQAKEFRFDATSLVETSEISMGQPQAAGYNPGVSSLTVNFNRIRVKWTNGDKGPSAEAMAVSDGASVPLPAVHFAVGDASLPGGFARAGKMSDENWLLSPKISAKGEDWLPVGGPSLVAAQMLRALADKEGVVLPEPVPGVAGAGAREIARHQSDELSVISRQTLRFSTNVAAELIGLAASHAIGSQPRSLDDSGSALAAWWRQQMPHVDWDGFSMENHSGLSTKSRATPRQVVEMLTHMAEKPRGDAYYHLLRASSWKGPDGKTVNIHAKTGTIAYGRGLAGYIDTADGRRLAFAVFFNDLAKRAALDAAFDPRADAIEPQSRSWRNRALRLEEALVNGWATGFWKK